MLKFLLFCFVGGGMGAYFGEPFAHENADVTLIIITVLTVFAGFLVAIISILGDPSLIPNGSWRTAEGHRKNIEDRLIKHTYLFVFYLIGIAMLFIGSMLVKSPDVIDGVKIWIIRAYLFTGITAFLLTLGLPSSIFALQMKRLDAEIEARRNAAGIKKSESNEE